MSANSQVDARLIEALRATIVEVEQQSGVAPDDPSLVALKQILLLKIADLEAQRAAESVNADTPTPEPPSAPEALPSVDPKPTGLVE